MCDFDMDLTSVLCVVQNASISRSNKTDFYYWSYRVWRKLTTFTLILNPKWFQRLRWEHPNSWNDSSILLLEVSEKQICCLNILFAVNQYLSTFQLGKIIGNTNSSLRNHHGFLFSKTIEGNFKCPSQHEYFIAHPDISKYIFFECAHTWW